MTTSPKITRLGRLRRFRQLATQALRHYPLRNPELKFLAYEGNIIYRVDSSERIHSRDLDALYYPGRYLLRVHMDYHSAAAIESELKWLLALRKDENLPVPEPVPTKSGDLVITVSVPGDESASRKCSVLRWVDGRFVSGRLTSAHIEAWGRIMARLHNHAARWKPPKGFVRPRRDWNGLFSDAAGFDHSARELRRVIPLPFANSFKEVTKRARRVMAELGTDVDAFGLVHADLMVSTNILFKGTEARAIDFDDCCLAFRMHDLAFALSSWQDSPQEPWVRNAFLEGYSQVRLLPCSQLKHLDLFLAIFNANLMLWIIDWQKANPKSSGAHHLIDKYGANLNRYVQRGFKF